MANIVTDLMDGSARQFTVYPSAARTAAPVDTMEFDSPGRANGLILVVDVTAFTTSMSITVKVDGVDRLSGKAYNLLTSAALTTTGTVVLRVRPGLTSTLNVTANDVLPPVFRVTVTQAVANSTTYSVAGFLTF